jgi:putative ABC transport system substrate-binding protein
MRRRKFITLLGGAVAVWPIVARAQQPAKMKRIAFVHPSNKVSEISVSGRPLYRAFFEELSRLGYVEGQNLEVERYSGEGRPERYAELARDVVNTHPDLILAVGARLSLDFKMATTTIPIVTVIIDPIAMGLVASIVAAGRQHHRRYYRWGIGTHWKAYRVAGRGDAKTIHRRLPCIATILGRSKR